MGGMLYDRVIGTASAGLERGRGHKQRIVVATLLQTQPISHAALVR